MMYMYKKTEKSKARKLLKRHNYMPTLNILSERGLGSQWYKSPQRKKQKTRKIRNVWLGLY